MNPQHIQDLITVYKAMPNSEWRNKVISHLKDAYAAAIVMQQTDPGYKSPAEIMSLADTAPAKVCNCDYQQVSTKNFSKSCPVHGCICPEGGTSINCPIHGSS